MSDDDWETDADFENDLSEEERRRAGSVAAASALAAQRSSGIDMNAIRTKGLPEAASLVPPVPVKLPVPLSVQLP